MSEETRAAIECRDLRVYRNFYLASDNLAAGYVEQFCLPGVNLTVKKGRITGLVGRSGAGKSTLLLALAGHLFWDAGSVEYDGLTWREHSREIRRKMAVVFDRMAFPARRSGLQIAEMTAEAEPWFDREGFCRRMARLELPADMPVKKYSEGMAKKFCLAWALSRRPETLVLDEPTTGVDPISRRVMLDLMQEFMEDPSHAILFSTHLTGDLDRIADEVVLMSRGQVIFQEEKEALRFRMAGPDGTLPSIEEMMTQLGKEGIR